MFVESVSLKGAVYENCQQQVKSADCRYNGILSCTPVAYPASVPFVASEKVNAAIGVYCI